MLFSIVYIVVSQNTLFPVIPFHHLSDCDLYTPPTTGREGETDAGGDENDQLGHNQELVPKGRTTWSCVFKHCSFKTTGSLVENRNKYFHAFLTFTDGEYTCEM